MIRLGIPLFTGILDGRPEAREANGWGVTITTAFIVASFLEGVEFVVFDFRASYVALFERQQTGVDDFYHLLWIVASLKVSSARTLAPSSHFDSSSPLAEMSWLGTGVAVEKTAREAARKAVANFMAEEEFKDREEVEGQI